MTCCTPGRTIRAALNEIFDYGRPASVTLAVLIHRDGRELPIEAQVVGHHIKLKKNQHIKLLGPEPLKLEIQSAYLKRDDLQFDSHGRLRHLLTIEGLRVKPFSIFSTPPNPSSRSANAKSKKVPLLRGKTVVNLFFEASTVPAPPSRSPPNALSRT